MAMKLAVVLSYLSLSIATLSRPSLGARFDHGAVRFLGKDLKFEVMGEPQFWSEPKRELVVQVRFENGSQALMTSTVIVQGTPASVQKALGLFQSNYHLERALFADHQLVQVSSPEEAVQLSQIFLQMDGVEFAHPDFIFPVESRSSPMDEPLFFEQWNLKNSSQNSGTLGVDIGVESVWAITQGAPETLIAVLDLGFEQGHKDLKEAWWINFREIAGNKKDDDGNGLIDDVSGWNFATNGNNLIYGASPNHGTATAGILGARVNGVGITGICPHCKLLPIVISGRVSEDAEAISYAYKTGATVMSNSWGYLLESPQTDAVTRALKNAAQNGRQGKGIPIIFAMRNANVNDCNPRYPDISGHPDVIAVSSVDHKDVKVVESGWGLCTAFVGPSSGAELYGIPVTDRTGKAGYNTDGNGNLSDLDYHRGFFGTSAAAPQVAGLFALLLTREPELTKEQALQRMRFSAIKANPVAAAYDPKTGHSLRYGYGRAHGGKLFQNNFDAK